MPRRLTDDRWLFFTAVLLALGGLFMVGSATPYVAMDYGRSSEAFYLRQLVHTALGFGVLLVAQSVSYRRLGERRTVLTLLGICFALLIVVLAMPAAGGARRWIPLGPLKLQPSELAKIVAVLFMAWMLSRKEDRIAEPARVAVPSLAVIGALAWLVVIEPDLGTAVIFTGTACVMLFVAGLGWRSIAGVGSLGAAAFTVAVIAEPYRVQRVKAFLHTLLDPSVAALGSNYQLKQSLIAIGSGGLTGVGLGQGQQKAYYVPETHTDFIFSVVGEELGLLGTMALLIAFVVIFWRGIRAARRAPDRFGFYLALGLTVLIVMQGLINMCVCIGLLPTKGLSLPFISYGGSSLLVSMAATGVLLNVSKHAD